MQKIWEDKELGKVVLKKRRNSKKCIIHIRPGTVSVTLPVWGSYKGAIEFVELHRQSLLATLKKMQPAPAVSDVEIRHLKLEALKYLPDRLQTLATAYNFTYSAVKISKSKSLWGSCSARKNIRLSLFLMKLPIRLIDYVILHELCHTVEMNHSIKFWELLDKTCNGKAKALRKELKAHQMKLFQKNADDTDYPR